MNTGENQKLKILNGEKDDHKGLELLQKFCIFLQNVNKIFLNFVYTDTGMKEGGGLGQRRDLSKIPIQEGLYSRITKK